MTRIYLFIMLRLLSALPTFAQKQDKTPWTVRYGIEAGVNGVNANTLNLYEKSIPHVGISHATIAMHILHELIFQCHTN